MTKLQKIKLISDACCRVPHKPGLSYNPGRGKSACAFLLLDDTDTIIEKQAKYLGECTVPEAEYAGLLFALDKAVEFCRDTVEVWMDSELVIRQMNGIYCLRSPNIKLWYDAIKNMERRFMKQVKYFHHDRGTFWARQADKLANEHYSKINAG